MASVDAASTSLPSGRPSARRARRASSGALASSFRGQALEIPGTSRGAAPSARSGAAGGRGAHAAAPPSCIIASGPEAPLPPAEEDETERISRMLSTPYKYGFTSDVPSDTIRRGLTEDTVRAISAKKREPEWMLEFRLRAFRAWLTMKEPAWATVSYPTIDYQNIIYYSEPKSLAKKQSMDEVDPELRRTFDKLGIPLTEQKRLSNVAVRAA